MVYRPLLASSENVNSVAQVYYQVCSYDETAVLAQLRLFHRISEEPAFSTLRTIEQLGYLVFARPVSFNGMKGFRVIIQSEKSPEFLQERIDSFWMGFSKTLADLSEEEIIKCKEGLKKKLLEKPKNLGDE